MGPPHTQGAALPNRARRTCEPSGSPRSTWPAVFFGGSGSGKRLGRQDRTLCAARASACQNFVHGRPHVLVDVFRSEHSCDCWEEIRDTATTNSGATLKKVKLDRWFKIFHHKFNGIRNTGFAINSQQAMEQLADAVSESRVSQVDSFLDERNSILITPFGKHACDVHNVIAAVSAYNKIRDIFDQHCSEYTRTLAIVKFLESPYGVVEITKPILKSFGNGGSGPPTLSERAIFDERTAQP